MQVRQDYLAADLVGRESAEDMRRFAAAVRARCRRHQLHKVLMSIRLSRALFKAEDYGIPGYAGVLAMPACQVALMGDTPELNAAHEHIEVMARQENLNVRAFADESAAARWLSGGAESPQRYRFSRTVVLGAPQAAGVYTLWDGEELVYYGRAMGGGATIRSRLLDHHSGTQGAATQGATHYSWEVCADPAAREAELLREYERAHGRLPRFNAASG
jgi:hypothetical protein